MRYEIKEYGFIMNSHWKYYVDWMEKSGTTDKGKIIFPPTKPVLLISLCG